MNKIIQYIYHSTFFIFVPFEVKDKWENEGYGINPIITIVSLSFLTLFFVFVLELLIMVGLNNFLKL